VKHQSRKSKEKGKPRQGSVECDPSNFEPTSSVFGVGNEQGDIATISERMAFIPVSRCGTIYFFVDSFSSKEKKGQIIKGVKFPKITACN